MKFPFKTKFWPNSESGKDAKKTEEIFSKH